LPRLAWALGSLEPERHQQRAALQTRLTQAGWSFGSVADADVVLAWIDDAGPQTGTPPLDEGALLADVQKTPVFLMGRSVTSDLPALREASGLVPRPWSAAHPSRLRADGASAWVNAVTPLGDEPEITTEVLSVDKLRDSVEVWVSAPMGLTRQPVVTWNPDTRVGVFTAVPDVSVDTGVDTASRVLHLTLRRALGIDNYTEAGAPPRLRVGLLGFGAIGAEHARAVEGLPGLELAMVCDRNEQRLQVLSDIGSDARRGTNADELLESDVDIVVVSTPPDSHADWALRALTSGKHVILEKPMALTVDEADSVLRAAADNDRRVVTYQNRRFDSDFLAVRREVSAGHIGDVFHTETFIGGYGHPCNYWHSDVDVSGGAIYDWGSHIIDQILMLHPEPIAHVTCIEHKRRWLDVTNADHSSLLIRFADGAEASFVHSDLAAALKPRWYVLGTDGALVSKWRSASVIARNEIGTLAEDPLAVTDSPPEIFRHDGDGSETAVTLPPGPPFPFHRELVDDLTFGWPMTVTPQQSRRVVAVMEAARASADSRGAPTLVDGET
jgi:predicted dehydrogenase